MKLNSRISRSDDGVCIFFCPGCDTYHGVWTEKPNDLTGARWSWNGNYEKPTFSPSILVNGGDGTPRCHSFVNDGVISYCSDSEHRLAGQSVELPTGESL
jgi:hypothetical protein